MNTKFTIERDAYRHDDATVTTLTTAQADEMQRLIDLDARYGEDLPAGVRWATVLDPGADCPDGWERKRVDGGWVTDGVPAADVARECRRIPAPATASYDAHHGDSEFVAHTVSRFRLALAEYPDPASPPGEPG